MDRPNSVMIVLPNPGVKDGGMAVDRMSDVYVAGRWQTAHSAADTLVINPTTEEPLARVVRGDAGDVDAAVRAGAAAAGGWGRTPVAERCALVERLAAEIEARRGAFTQLITTENGT